MPSLDLTGILYIYLDGVEYEGWFAFNINTQELIIEDTLIENLANDTYDNVNEQDFIDFFENNLISISL